MSTIHHKEKGINFDNGSDEAERRAFFAYAADRDPHWTVTYTDTHYAYQCALYFFFLPLPVLERVARKDRIAKEVQTWRHQYVNALPTADLRKLHASMTAKGGHRQMLLAAIINERMTRAQDAEGFPYADTV